MLKYFVLFISLLFGVASGSAKKMLNNITFSHIGLEDGLSHSSVLDILQDRKGNMWFATFNGLNRYDGYDFQVYRHNSADTLSISSDITYTLELDDKNRLWIGTYNGLSVYDEDSDTFRNLSYMENGKRAEINGITTVNDSLLLVCANSKLLLYDTVKGVFTRKGMPQNLLALSEVSVCRQDNSIYICSSQGLYVYDVIKKNLRLVASDILSGIRITSVLKQSQTRLWVGTDSDGLYLLNPQTNEMKCYKQGLEGGISSNHIRTLAFDAQNRLWVGTMMGLNIYREDTDSFQVFESSPIGKNGLSHSSVRSLFLDSQGGMWVGTFYGGLSYYHPLKEKFRYGSLPGDGEFLNSNIIGCITEDWNGDIWIGTNGGGVSCYDTKDMTYSYTTKGKDILSKDVKVIYCDERRKEIYIGLHAGGLAILNRHTGRIESYQDVGKSTIAGRSVYTIIPIGDGNYWLGTLDGIVQFNPQNRTFTPAAYSAASIKKSTRITCPFLRDSKGRIWVGSEVGLTIYIQKGNQLEYMPLLPPGSFVSQNFIVSVTESSDGMFWIGTREGLYGFDESKNSFVHYSTADGLSNNVVYAILEDAKRNLWIATDAGLNLFNPAKREFRRFTSVDGLPTNQLTSAHLKMATGKMFFGSINGIVSFHPHLLADNPYAPVPVINELRLFNRVVHPGDKTGILTKTMSNTNSITLSGKQTMFSLKFSVPNYIAGTHNTFEYMLEGYDKEWYRTTHNRIVSYSNLPAGTYIFKVKAANNDEKWQSNPAVLRITVLPMWYKTWWAYSLYVLVFFLIIAFAVCYWAARKRNKVELEMERKDKERQREVNDMKLRFFINMSHELRTPLTLLLTPLDELLQSVDNVWMRKQLDYMKRSTNRLLFLVNQLMDYRRAELGVFELKVKQVNVYSIIEKVFMMYEQLSREKGIGYELSEGLRENEYPCDSYYMEMIMNNLLSNAFKYTARGGRISVELSEVGNELRISVKDTGCGIPLDKQEKIFDRFYQVKQKNVGSGIGLSIVKALVNLHHGRIEIDSTEGVGTCFSIYLSRCMQAYKQDEIAVNGENESEISVVEPASDNGYVTEAGNDAHENDTEQVPVEQEKENTILIVEDDADIAHYLCEELGKHYHVLWAENGKVAVEIVKDEAVDLIITDVMMPEMDGLQLCKRIKQNLVTCHIPIIIVSAKTELDEQLDGMDVGADDYIPKPFSLLMLRAKIRNIFRTRNGIIEHFSKSATIEPDKLAINQLDAEFIKHAVEVVEKHLDNSDFSTDDFARELLMSRSNLHLKMKALTGESSYEFIRKIRFNHACKLLKDGRYNVTEVSMMTGFSTASYFAMSFKKKFGCLPSEYIKKNRPK